jgi:dTMP kinase
MNLGRFICLEGIEGAGKTTQAQFIDQYLQAQGYKTLLTREPGGTPLAENIRQLILTPIQNESLTAETELLLLFAARAQHITQTLKPALKKRQWVICDRFTEATYAYQGGGRGLPHVLIEQLQRFIQKDLKIDRVLLFDLTVETAFKRMRNRKHCTQKVYDRIESETYHFFTRVREAYLMRAKQFPSLYRVIDADKPLTTVQQQVTVVLQELLAIPPKT